MDRQALATRDEVARFCQVSKATVARWATEKTGPPYVVIGRHARYEWPRVEEWLASQVRGVRTSS